MDETRPLLGESVPVKIQLGFLVQLVVLVVGMAVSYQATRSDIATSLLQSEKNETEMKILEVQLTKLSLDLTIQSQKLDDFHAIYERDFNTYIREKR